MFKGFIIKIGLIVTRILVMLSILISSYAYSNEATERLNPIELGSPRSTMRTLWVMDNILSLEDNQSELNHL